MQVCPIGVLLAALQLDSLFHATDSGGESSWDAAKTLAMTFLDRDRELKRLAIRKVTRGATVEIRTPHAKPLSGARFPVVYSLKLHLQICCGGENCPS